MDALLGMHPADKNYDFVAVASRRRRYCRSRHWIRDDGNFVRESWGFRGNGARHGLRRSLQAGCSSVKTHLSFWITSDLNVNASVFGISQQNREPERVGHDDVRIGQDRHRPERINQVEKFQPNE